MGFEESRLSVSTDTESTTHHHHHHHHHKGHRLTVEEEASLLGSPVVAPYRPTTVPQLSTIHNTIELLGLARGAFPERGLLLRWTNVTARQTRAAALIAGVKFLGPSCCSRPLLSSHHHDSFLDDEHASSTCVQPQHNR